MPKTKAEIEELKRDWEADPCFDLEDAEGFEEHKAELYLFRVETELRWARNEVTLLRAAIDKYKGNYIFNSLDKREGVKYIRRMEVKR